MRDFLDSILVFIGSETLTDPEFDTVPESLTVTDYYPGTYGALKSILDSRESVSETHLRLQAVFRAKGVSLTDDAIIPQSNILIGEEL